MSQGGKGTEVRGRPEPQGAGGERVGPAELRGVAGWESGGRGGESSSPDLPLGCSVARHVPRVAAWGLLVIASGKEGQPRGRLCWCPERKGWVGVSEAEALAAAG